MKGLPVPSACRNTTNRHSPGNNDTFEGIIIMADNNTPDRETIYAHLRDSLVAMFEIPEADISPEARLYEDLDIDSLDAVDLVVRLRDLTGIQVKPEQFQDVRTVGDVVNAVQALTDAKA